MIGNGRRGNSNESALAARLAMLYRSPLGKDQLLVRSPDYFRELVSELLALSGPDEAIRWMRESRTQVAAKITLWRALRYLSLVVQAELNMNQTNAARTLAAIRHWVPKTVAPDEIVRVLDTVDEDILPSGSTLLSALERLRRLHALHKFSMPPRHELAERTANLMTLPTEADPWHWMESNVRDLAAEVALELLLRTLFPAPRSSTDIGAVASVTHPDLSFRGGGIKASLELVKVGSQGFSLKIRIRYHLKTLALPSSFLMSAVEWRGFDRILDDMGHMYLPFVVARAGRSTGPSDWSETVEIIAYPSPAAGTVAITLTSDAGSVSVRGFVEAVKERDFDQSIVPVHHIELAWPRPSEFVWVVPLKPR